MEGFDDLEGEIGALADIVPGCERILEPLLQSGEHIVPSVNDPELCQLVGRLKLIADNGNVDAQLLYASFLGAGVGVIIDLCESARYVKQSADNGNGKAQLRYGKLLQSGSGVPVDLFEAARYFKMAADQGIAEAQFRYVMCLGTCDGAPIDMCEAARYERWQPIMVMEKRNFCMECVFTRAMASLWICVKQPDILRWLLIKAM